jgi:hypothetical protein
MDEEVSSGVAIFPAVDEGLPFTLSGKLKQYCPSLFSSLTMWEKETLDSSGWLKRVTTDTKGVSEGLQEGLETGKVKLSVNGTEGRIPSSALDCGRFSVETFPPSSSTGVPGITADQERESMDCDVREFQSYYTSCCRVKGGAGV